jgi:hypothetical protein
MAQRLYIFDSASRRCLGSHPDIADDPIRVTGGNANAVGLVAEIDAPTRALRLSPDGTTIVRNPRREARARKETAIRALASEASDPLLEAVVRILVDSIPAGSAAETALPAPAKAILVRLRDEVLPRLSLDRAGDLDDAIAAKIAQKAIDDGLPSRA